MFGIVCSTRHRRRKEYPRKRKSFFGATPVLSARSSKSQRKTFALNLSDRGTTVIASSSVVDLQLCNINFDSRINPAFLQKFHPLTICQWVPLLEETPKSKKCGHQTQVLPKTVLPGIRVVNARNLLRLRKRRLRLHWWVYPASFPIITLSTLGKTRVTRALRIDRTAILIYLRLKGNKRWIPTCPLKKLVSRYVHGGRFYLWLLYIIFTFLFFLGKKGI